MNAPDILSSIAAELEEQLRGIDPPQRSENAAPISTGLASALLQKSIRRGRVDLALIAASVLFDNSPDRLWRRLVIIAIEDVGLGGLPAMYQAVAASATRRQLARHLGGWTLAAHVVSTLAATPKCRASDDLYVAIADCSRWRDDTLEISHMSFGEALDIIAGSGPIERRAIATRCALGAAQNGGPSAERQHQVRSMFDHLCEIDQPHTLVEVAREAYRQTGETISAFLPLLHVEFDPTLAHRKSDTFPDQTLIGQTPGWAYDKFSHGGRAALRVFLETDCDTARWLRSHVAPGERAGILGHALFRVESGLVADRVIWPIGQSLRHQADCHSWPFSKEDAATLLSLLRSEIGVLNQVRVAANER
ncbi:hypothetical protein [Mesorhizobium sp. IMUNJ 23232]|uniref:AAA family ATPase n=1 Tax=Mesorhizobium sp. IMUNJ 23232 TaxID=3376064 RepID=UPI0037B8E1E1